MTFHPGIAAADAAAGRGTIDYRLQRMRVIADVESGVLSKADACDVHPELMRVARNVAVSSGEDCPICLEPDLRIVSYVFGPRLGGGGKCVTTMEERRRLAQRAGDFACYDVEVCPHCGWNHLLRRYPLED